MKLNSKFKTVLFGYSKEEVNRWITKLFDDFEYRLKEKEEEINQLNNQLKEYKSSLEIQFQQKNDNQIHSNESNSVTLESKLNLSGSLTSLSPRTSSQVDTIALKQIIKQLKMIEDIHKEIEDKILQSFK